MESAGGGVAKLDVVDASGASGTVLATWSIPLTTNANLPPSERCTDLAAAELTFPAHGPLFLVLHLPGRAVLSLDRVQLTALLRR
jgi:hypothetical protein